MNHYRRVLLPLAILCSGAAMFAAGGCGTLAAPGGFVIEDQSPAFAGRYVTLTPQQIKDMLPRPTTEGEALEFEGSLTHWATQLNDGGRLKAWSEESSRTPRST